ncbi:MAG: S-adenosylmethionine:tRNA ribosyltransferase-isomerase [Verrucomicrobia bacterium 13_1_40CM_4_54_4]|nr:MAG: S-adenosylmethionine:tRNA ribosyltransferase-isomerase [Verrucomicrobia bacterium 13_1_40CM_4_54_4]
MTAPFTFTLPPELSAKEPPERRGIRRDQVRLLVIDRAAGHIEHTRFDKIGDYLRAGDLLVFNSSRTLPAALRGCECSAAHGPCMEVRLAERLPDDSWLALLLCEQGDPFGCGLREGMQIEFAEGLAATVLEHDANIPRLWKLHFSVSGTHLVDLIYRLGKPIRYEYISAPWDLDYYQTVYAKEPGSAEMPSAGRAFTWKLLLDLKGRGIESAYIILHTGLSSYMDDELDRAYPASEEEYFVSQITAEKVNSARENGGRVIAVGTTVVRALESVADSDGCVNEKQGYTRLTINSQHRLKAVDGLLTGLHEPEASHLDLLSAFLSAEKIRAAYEEAIARKYLWHEFGDLNLIL